MPMVDDIVYGIGIVVTSADGIVRAIGAVCWLVLELVLSLFYTIGISKRLIIYQSM